uniref:Uncharacterized protein n=1 Tax=Glossina morsitans morsitans TaxID=37546 RepID=A0ABK9NGI0_GLOMM
MEIFIGSKLDEEVPNLLTADYKVVEVNDLRNLQEKLMMNRILKLMQYISVNIAHKNFQT